MHNKIGWNYVELTDTLEQEIRKVYALSFDVPQQESEADYRQTSCWGALWLWRSLVSCAANQAQVEADQKRMDTLIAELDTAFRSGIDNRMS